MGGPWAPNSRPWVGHGEVYIGLNSEWVEQLQIVANAGDTKELVEAFFE